MKNLTLIRHAKSSHSDHKLSDIQRPLNARGMSSSSLMGSILKDQNFKFDRLFCSPANRATATAQRLCTQLNVEEEEIQIEPALYTFDMEDLYRFIEQIDNSVEHAVIISHNPGITLLANDLSLSSIKNIPTCGVVRLELNLSEWVDVNTGTAKLLDFDYPRKHLAK